MNTFLDDVSTETMGRDPYPVFERLRREAPVAFFHGTGQWLIARWDDCMRVGTDPETFGPSQLTAAGFGPSVLTASGAEHEWIRSGIDPHLRPKFVQKYIQELARPVAVAYLDDLSKKGHAELTGEFFELVSSRIVGDVLGLDGIDDATRRQWFTGIAAFMDDLGSGKPIPAQTRAAVSELDVALGELVDRVTKTPNDTLLSMMVHAGVKDRGPQTYAELAGTIRVIITGGFQEPGHAAASILYGLLTNPGQYAEVVASQGKAVPAAVHEGLRWLPPFSACERVTLRDVELAGVQLPAGSELSLLIGSANHDESRWDNPSVYDMHRPMQAHCAFGFGTHMCAGNALARRMEHILLEEIAARLPNLRLDPDGQAETAGFQMRAVKTFPVVWDA